MYGLRLDIFIIIINLSSYLPCVTSRPCLGVPLRSLKQDSMNPMGCMPPLSACGFGSAVASPCWQKSKYAEDRGKQKHTMDLFIILRSSRSALVRPILYNVYLMLTPFFLHAYLCSSHCCFECAAFAFDLDTFS